MSDELKGIVSELRRALMDKVTLLDSLCDCAPCLMWVKDLQGNYAYANARHRKDFLGIGEMDPLDGVTDGDHDMATSCRISDEMVIKHDRPIRVLEAGKDADGSTIYLQVHKAPWRDSAGTLQGTVGVATDVTERLRAQENMVEAFRLKIARLGITEELAPEMKLLEDYTSRHRMTDNG